VNLPPNITLQARPAPDRSTDVLLDGAVIGSYVKRHSGGGYRFRNEAGAYGDCARAFDAVVSLVEIARRPA
jgi:hypothetical protein